jgi:uncharacterized membrane protein
MPEEDEGQPSDHFREGRKQLEKGTQKVLEQGIEKGKKQRKKLEYYRRNRSDLINDFSTQISNNKKPAVSGLIVLLPVFVVLLVVGWLFDKIAAIPGNQYLNISQYLVFLESGSLVAYYMNQTIKLAVILGAGAVIVTLVGRAVRTDQGFRLEKLLDGFFDRIPFLGSIYNITKVTTETVFGGADDLSRPVKVNHGDIRLNAFKTGNTTEDGRDIVFLPTAPNITSGLVLELPEEKLEESEDTPEEALTKILSAGFGNKKKNGEEEDQTD